MSRSTHNTPPGSETHRSSQRQQTEQEQETHRSNRKSQSEQETHLNPRKPQPGPETHHSPRKPQSEQEQETHQSHLHRPETEQETKPVTRRQSSLPVPLPPLPETPLVSILIPNYNHAEFVGEAVRSALNQSWQQVEVLVCDDGSTDHSRSVLSTFQSDSRVRILYKKNGGQASAVNAAFAESRGEIIALLDADDLFHSEKIQHVVDAFRQEPEAGLLIHRLDKIDGRGEVYGQLPMVPALPQGWYREQVITTGSSPHGFPVTSGLVLRRQVASRIFPVSDAVVYDLDEMVRRLSLLITPVTAIDASLGTYRIHGGNVTALDVADRLEKMLPIYRVMAEETRRFVEQSDPTDLKRLPVPEEDINLLLMRYVLIRLNRAPAQGDMQANQWKVPGDQTHGPSDQGKMQANHRLEPTHQSKESTEREVESSAHMIWETIQKSSSFQSWSVVRRGFWQVTVRMPLPLFKRSVALYWNSNGYKLQLTRLKKSLRL